MESAGRDEVRGGGEAEGRAAGRRLLDGGAAAALAQIEGGLDALFEAGVRPGNADDAATWVAELERLGSRLDAARVALTSQIAQCRWHRADGYSSPASMVEHLGRVGPGTAHARQRAARVTNELPVLDAALRSGDIGVDHLQVVAKLRRNPVVRERLADHQHWLAAQARTLPVREFETVATAWARTVDDNWGSVNARAHAERDLRIRQHSVDLTWTVSGGCGALQGAKLAEIHQAYVEAELAADWAAARAAKGDDATSADLPRNTAQRRADALSRIFADAAASGRTSGVPTVHNIVWSAEAFEALLAAIDGNHKPSVDPGTYRCETADGVALEPREAATAALVDQVRRVVTDAAGVTIDLGRARFFTGSARLAALLHSPTCVWPGCHHAASRCEVDHLRPHARGGQTRPANGAPLCGRHNRWKQHGFTVARNPDGAYRVLRPDGSPVGRPRPPTAARRGAGEQRRGRDPKVGRESSGRNSTPGRSETSGPGTAAA